MLQHRWAELSEKLSDVIDPAIKYGGGSDDIQKALNTLSDVIDTFADLEVRVAESGDSKRQSDVASLKQKVAENFEQLLQAIIREEGDV